jgi:hypothetical protein
VLGLEDELDAAQMNALARVELGLGHGRAVDESAICGPEVPYHRLAAFEDNLAVRTGDGRMVNLEVVSEATT